MVNYELEQAAPEDYTANKYENTDYIY